MLEAKYQTYLQQLDQEFSVNSIAEIDFFLILETPLVTANLQASLQKLREDCLNTTLTDLASFESFLNQEIIKLNLPASFSLAAAYFKDNLLYLKTYGQGEVYLKRKNNLVKLVDAENTASGFLQKEDRLVLTTKNFTNHLRDKDSLKKICAVKNIADINQQIEGQLRRKNLDLISLFISFDQFESKKSAPVLPAFNLTQIKDSLRVKLATSNKKKILTLILVIFLLLIFVWSVVFGHQRRVESDQKQKIQTVNELVVKKLAEAEDVGFLNSTKALSLISEAKDSVDKLKNELGDKHVLEINNIYDLIKKKENIILKKEEKAAEEFFDLKIDNKNAVGVKMSLADDNLVILDNKNGAIYNLSLLKKSLVTETVPEAKSADLITNQPSAVFIFVKNSGVYKSGAGKTNKVIDYDKAWGEISQMVDYNSNLYLLDKNKNQIYKYLATDNGYASGSAYFKSGQEIDLASADSLAINGSLYISSTDEIVKYTSGLRDGYKTNYPQDNVKIDKIIADKNLEKIFTWDKSNAALYILDKDGAYEREINVGVLGKANDVVVYENKAYVLSGDKINSISL